MPPGRQTKRRQEQLTDEVKRIRRADPANLTCADCPVRATPCVVTDYGIFVCTDCGGVHRQHSHRVKSISIATFTEAEVERLRNTGNAISNAKYLAKHKEGKDLPLPKEGDRKKIEEFILQKYVRQEWYKENPRPPRKKKGKKGRRRRSSTVDDDDDDDQDEDDVPRRNSHYDVEPQPPQTQIPPVIEEHIPSQPVTQPVNNQPDDLLSFDSFASPQPAATTAAPVTAAPVQDAWDAFGPDFSNPQPVAAVAQPVAAQPQQQADSWDPWGDTPTATAAPVQSAQPVPAAQPPSDPLWGDFFQQPTATPAAQNDTIFGMDPEPQPTQPAPVEQKPPEPQPKAEYADPFADLATGLDTGYGGGMGGGMSGGMGGGVGGGGIMDNSMASLGSGLSPDHSMSSLGTGNPMPGMGPTGMNPTGRNPATAAAPSNPYASPMGPTGNVGYPPQPAVPAPGYGPGPAAYYPTYPAANQFGPPATSYGPPTTYGYPPAGGVPGYGPPMTMNAGPAAQPAPTAASDNPFL